MVYKRKTRDEYQLWGMYEGKWEYILAEDTYKGAKQRLKEYVENEGGQYIIKKRRIMNKEI